MHRERFDALLRHARKCRFNLAIGCRMHNVDLPTASYGCGFDLHSDGFKFRSAGVDEDSKTSGLRQELKEHAKTPERKQPVHSVADRSVAAGPVEAGTIAELNRVEAGAENDWYCCGRGFGNRNSSRASTRRGDHVHSAID